MNRGDVYWADLHPRSGAEQHGKRPVVVVSHDAFNQAPGWRSVIVLPCSTSSKQRRRGPSAVAVDKGVGGLKEPGVVLCHQITTLDRAKLKQKIGTLPENILRAIEIGILAALDIERE